MTSQKSYERLLYVIFTSCVHWYVSNEKRGWSPLNKSSKKTANHHIFWVCLVYEFCETEWQKQSLYGHFHKFYLPKHLQFVIIFLQICSTLHKKPLRKNRFFSFCLVPKGNIKRMTIICCIRNFFMKLLY